MESTLTDTSSSSDPKRAAFWSPWATVLLGFLILIISAIGQDIGMTIAINQQGIALEYEEVRAAASNESLVLPESAGVWEQIEALLKASASATEKLSTFIAQNDLMWSTALGGGLLGSLAVILLVMMRRRLSIVDYLNLRNVPLKVWCIWLGVTAIMVTGMEMLSANNESFESAFMEQLAIGAQNIPMLFIGVGIIAPIFEELLFRGFVFKGLERGKLGGHGAVWATAIFFAIIHLQYSWAIIALIVPMGLLLGYSRMYSGSLLVPIALHVLNNSVAVILSLSAVKESTGF